MKDTFLQAIREEYPNEQVTRLVFADWCLENWSELEEKLRKYIPPSNELRIKSVFEDGIDCGYLSGHGDGSIEGFGRGDFAGSGSGDGYGFQGANGYLNGYGDGSGYLYGNGDGHGAGGVEDIYTSSELKMPKLHQNQLLFLPFGFVFCGYVEEQIEPYVFKIINASFVLRYNAFWHEVANNSNRSDIRFLKFGTITIGPQIFTSMDWEGDLP